MGQVSWGEELRGWGPDVRTLGYLPRKTTNREWNHPNRTKHFAAVCLICQEQLTRMKAGDLKSSLMLEMELQSLYFDQLLFGLALVQYFLRMTFWKGSVYPVMLEVCDLLFYFVFIGDCS
jgi:hypothetical protein